ncbi:hypothetical protein [Sediminitomix flava]|uniref:SH3 domain-containing protein n=1 Tax=Sediminitomix flava TaxID=379075 RepID=A0A315ZC10_SEDFL|nr:hypothetical protein [Sediminitomix flava]PWJ43105.1 hypothetical protein BC781_102653 [Sediminitomix flava]
MKYFLAFIFLASTLSLTRVQAQIVSAIINDSDGYTNVREIATIQSEIKDKFVDGEVFEFNSDDKFEKKNWISVYLNRDSRSKCGQASKMMSSGFLHSSRLLPLSEIKTTYKRKRVSVNLIELSSDNFKVFIETRKLSDKENKELFYECLWGTDTGNPSNVIHKITIQIEQATFDLPTNAFNDLYKVTLDKSYLKKYKDFIYVTMSNSDGAGFYEVTWVFKENKYLRRYINQGP